VLLVGVLGGVFVGVWWVLCGDGFPGMQFKVHALPADQFAMWAQGVRGQGAALDGRAYTELSKPSSYVKPITYGAVAPGLFDGIVANRLPLAPGQHNQPTTPQGG
jgi:cytochrome o ubiquinol oxidase subunit 2